METLRNWLPILTPFIVLQVILVIVALIDLFKVERRVKGGNKVVWAVVIILVDLIGPLAYFVAGRKLT